MYIVLYCIVMNNVRSGKWMPPVIVDENGKRWFVMTNEDGYEYLIDDQQMDTIIKWLD